MRDKHSVESLMSLSRPEAAALAHELNRSARQEVIRQAKLVTQSFTEGQLHEAINQMSLTISKQIKIIRGEKTALDIVTCIVCGHELIKGSCVNQLCSYRDGRF